MNNITFFFIKFLSTEQYSNFRLISPSYIFSTELNLKTFPWPVNQNFDNLYFSDLFRYKHNFIIFNEGQ